MAENIGRSKGRGTGYKFDRGGMPAEGGPYVGTVVNNVDGTRTGRLQVYIEQFGDGTVTSKIPQSDKSLWRTVRYLSPFYGQTQQGASGGVGKFANGNPHSYGMWFTAPDIGSQVICFFIGGDPNKGYYVGCIPQPGLNHMVPAIGAATEFNADNDAQKSLFANAKQLPVIEINSANARISNDPRFFNQPKPVHSVQASILFAQGLDTDTIRGAITSSSQRESPSRVFGVSTPGRPIYQGGATQTDSTNLASGQTTAANMKIIGRRGGHTFVLDDGDTTNKDNLIRIRTSKGHQITMSDNGDCFYITHANGLTWMEFGKEGTVDLYSTNSVNVRTRGTINLHADKDINMFAGGKINMKSSEAMVLESATSLTAMCVDDMKIYSKGTIGVLSDGTLALQSGGEGSWGAGGSLTFEGAPINLNSGGAASVDAPTPLTTTTLDDTSFQDGTGWTVDSGALESIVTRAPTHEPYPYHNKGVTPDGADAGTGDATLSDEEIADNNAALGDFPG